MIYYEGSVINQFDDAVTGNAFFNATITVRKHFTNALAELYSDDGVTPTDNPVKSNSLGDYSFYVSAGVYRLVVNEGTVQQKELSNVFIAEAGLVDVDSLSDMTESTFPSGTTVNVRGIGNAKFLIQQEGTDLEAGDITATNKSVCKIQPMDNGQWNVLHFGAVPDNTSVVYQEAFQNAVDRGIIYVPKGDYTVTSLTIPSGGGIIGEHRTLTRIFKEPNTAGHLVYSPPPTNNADSLIRLEHLTLHGNRALFTDANVSDGVHIAGGRFEAQSVLAKSVWCRGMTGSGWYIGAKRNIPELYDCYGFDVDGHGLEVNSVSDLIAVHCGFGSAGGNSVLVGTSGKPVFIGCEIWWANGNASVNLYQNTTFMLIGCKLKLGRNGVVRVVGRVGVDDRHENGFINGCSFFGPRGVDGNGSDGDLNFIDLINTRGVNIVGNNFESTPSNGADVLVDYIVSISDVVENVGWTGNNYSTDSRKPYVTGVYSAPGAGPFNTKLINLEARRAVFGSPNNTAVEMGRSTFGKVTLYKLDDIEYGAMSVRANGLRLKGQSGVTFNMFGPYVDDAAAASAGIDVGESYYNTSGDVKIRLS